MTNIGAITGIIGAITGISGAIMGYIAYRRSGELKKSDRRLDLQKITSDAQLEGTYLLEILVSALVSRKTLFTLAGALHSGSMELYESQHATDTKRATELGQQLEKLSEASDYDSMSLKQLEQGLVRIGEIKGEIDHLIRRYKEWMEEDERARNRLGR